jgi:cytosine/adenosine deaminase-related metal-dependent hydrolase
MVRLNLWASAAAMEAAGRTSNDKPRRKTLLPGFIDGHAHFANFSAQAIGAQILPPPDAGAKNIPTLIEILKEWNTEEIEL